MHPGAEAWSIRQSEGKGGAGEDQRGRTGCGITPALPLTHCILPEDYSAGLHCTAAPSVTVMPVDRGLLEVEDQTEAPLD